MKSRIKIQNTYTHARESDAARKRKELNFITRTKHTLYTHYTLLSLTFTLSSTLSEEEKTLTRMP
jgi:hypothetical protein